MIPKEEFQNLTALEARSNSKENIKQKISSNTTRLHKSKPIKVPLREPDRQIESHIRVSSRPEEADIDYLMTMFIKNRSWHGQFNSQIGTETSRQAIRDYIFQDT